MSSMGTVCSREDKHESAAVLYNHPLPTAFSTVLTETSTKKKRKVIYNTGRPTGV